jgi:hypothetical protein
MNHIYHAVKKSSKTMNPQLKKERFKTLMTIKCVLKEDINDHRYFLKGSDLIDTVLKKIRKIKQIELVY